MLIKDAIVMRLKNICKEKIYVSTTLQSVQELLRQQFTA